MIIWDMEFHYFSDCKSLLEMMEDGEFVIKYKHDLETKFEEMLTWFINVKLGIITRPISPYAADNRKVDLLGLYMVVKRDGSYRNVTDNNLWVVVAKDMSYEYHDGEFMRIIYAMYLDVLFYVDAHYVWIQLVPVRLGYEVKAEVKISSYLDPVRCLLCKG
ncbi:putative transcription factor & chromatin remodeling ARID family [Helianthus anomalus]